MKYFSLRLYVGCFLHYLEYIKSLSNLNVLIIDISDLDFVKKQQDYVFILNEIHKKIEN